MSNFVLGVDLAQTVDYSALVLVERVIAWRKSESVAVDAPGVTVDAYIIAAVRRFPLRTPYHEVVAAIGELKQDNPVLESADIAVDITGSGRVAFIEEFWPAWKAGRLGGGWLHPYVIHGGRDVNRHRVPLVELGGRLRMLLENGRLSIIPGLAHGELLMKELAAFRVKTVPGTGLDTYSSRTQRDHDDLVFAALLGLWDRNYHDEPRRIDAAPVAVPSE